MSADGLSGLAVDDLGRSLLGWQFAGWRFEIPHDPLPVAFLEPGAPPAEAPELAPLQGLAPMVTPAEVSSEEPLDGPAPSSMGARSAAPAPQQTASSDDTPLGLMPRPIETADHARADGPPSLSAASDDFALAPIGGAGSGFPPPAAQPVNQIVTPDITDFFEFNVILQVNVLLDSDLVVQTHSGDGDNACGLSIGQWAMTGGNTQSNTATITDAGGYGDFDWLGGSYHQTNQIHSVNALDDGDLAFNLFTGSALEIDQGIVGGANAQGNKAAIHSRTGGEGPVPEGVGMGPADEVEYNVTTQINFMNDADLIAQHVIGSGASTQMASTGANTQSNNALLVDHNTAPEHDIPGNYYEYNLIYQANVMDDADQVAQIAASGPPGTENGAGGLSAEAELIPQSLYGDTFA